MLPELDFFEPLLSWLATTSAITKTIAPPTIAKTGASLLSRLTVFLLDSPPYTPIRSQRVFDASGGWGARWCATGRNSDCLLYTSDAADEEDSVDLGGRRISKKKNAE